MEFIGQQALLNTLSSYTLSTLPKTILFIGERGCGKHTIAKILANRLNLELVTFESDFAGEDLVEFQQKPVETLYVIDLANFSEKQQNQFLKFIEEPSPYVYVLLIAESESGILDTILNRCMKYQFENYSVDQLKQIAEYPNDLIYKVCRTPGKLKEINSDTIDILYNLCYLLTTRLTNSTYANVMKIPSKLNYKDNYDKPNFDLFFNMMEYVTFQEFTQNNNLEAFKQYKITKEFQQNMLDKNIAKENYIINYITRLWEEAYYGNSTI